MTETDIVKDLTESLGRFVKNYLTSQDIQVSISYDDPTPKLKETLQMPIINIFCMDISLKNVPKSDTSGEKIKLKIFASYLISVFAESSMEEQRLFGQIIIILNNLEDLPEEDLQGSLREEKEKVKITFPPVIDYMKKLMLFESLKTPYRLSQGIQLETQFCCGLPKRKKETLPKTDLGFL